jgi:hypothetical protein
LPATTPAQDVAQLVRAVVELDAVHHGHALGAAGIGAQPDQLAGRRDVDALEIEIGVGRREAVGVGARQVDHQVVALGGALGQVGARHRGLVVGQGGEAGGGDGGHGSSSKRAGGGGAASWPPRPGLGEHRGPGDHVADELEGRLDPRQVGLPGQAAGGPRRLEGRSHAAGHRHHLGHRQLAALDRQEGRRQRRRHLQRRRRVAVGGQPTGREIEQPDQVVGVLGALIARRGEGQPGAGGVDQGVPRRRRELTLIVERTIELLHVVAAALAGQRRGVAADPGRGGQSGRDLVEGERGVRGQPGHDLGAVIGQALVVLQAIEL